MASIIDPEIDLNVYQSNQAIGGPGGNRYCLENSNALLTSLTVHRDNTNIRGLDIKLSNGQSMIAGKLIDSNPVVLDFTGSQLTSITLYYGSTYWGPDMITGILIYTSKGTREAYCLDFTAGAKGTLPVGSGYCAGVFGRAGETVDALGFAMLKMPPSK